MNIGLKSCIHDARTWSKFSDREICSQSICSFYGKAAILLVMRFSDRELGPSSSIVDKRLYGRSMDTHQVQTLSAVPENGCANSSNLENGCEGRIKQSRKTIIGKTPAWPLLCFSLLLRSSRFINQHCIVLDISEELFRIVKMVVRQYQEELKYLEKINECCWRIKKGFQPNMKVEGVFYVNNTLERLMFDELRNSCRPGAIGGFLPGMKQIANVAALPGIVWRSVGLPDVHSGYGFAIGNMAAFDMDDPKSIVSPGGVGFDINCGVRLLRTNLFESDVSPVKEQLAQSMFDHIPVGVGSKGIIPMNAQDLEEALEMGMDWSLREGYIWAEDKEHCEEYGRMLNADPSKVSMRAKKRGLPQLGTLGAGNHYAEIQVVDEIYDKWAACKMGIEEKGQICVMIHSGSRGFGHQVATDALVQMEKAMKRDNIETNDRQLACAHIKSQEGQDYLKAMAAAANFAWVNRSSMTFLSRQAFAKQFNSSPDDLDMHVIYDVSHNIAKIEEHIVEGKQKTLLVHRKGSTRAFPPHHPLIPVDYQLTGQPVLIGGTMGTCSYVLTGTEQGMKETFGSTCHGAGRALSRAKSRRNLDYMQVLNKLEELGISIRVASPKLVMEEAPESYKNVTDVVNTCHAAGISKKCIKLRPIAVIKG